MVFKQIRDLKQEFTDKYVVVDEQRPELRRFRGLTGTVRTVNMSGRALVEFDGNNNIGWFDIDPSFLQVIDEPLAKPEPEKAKPKAKQTPAKPAKEESKPATDKPATGGAAMSVEDILAAARGGNPAEAGVSASTTQEKPAEVKPAAAPAPKSAAGMSVEEILAAARGEESGTASSAAPAPAASEPKKVDPANMSVEEILAAARGEKSGAATETPVTEPEAAAPETAAAPAAEPETSSDEPLPTDIDGILAYCRRVDA